MSGVEQLQAMFPDAAAEALEAVLSMLGGDVAAATNFLLGEEGGGGGGAAPPANNNAAAEPAMPAQVPGGDEEADEEEADGEEEEVDDDDDGDGEEEDDEEGVMVMPAMPPSAKRMKTVEPSDPSKQVGKLLLAQFDKQLLRKTYLELLNIMPSKLSHSTITLWSEEVSDEKEASKLLSAERGGWWVLHFPTAEIDHVWRVLVNAHVQARRTAFGPVVHISGQSFSHAREGSEVEVRVMVREVDELEELKRIGGALLGIAPTSHGKQNIFFLRGPLPSASADEKKPGGGGHHSRSTERSRTQLEEASEYKLTKEKRPADGGAAASTVGSKRPISMMHPFGLADPDRVVFQLFKIDKSGGINWVKVL